MAEAVGSVVERTGSRYSFVEVGKRTVRIEGGPDRVPVTVECNGFRFQISAPGAGRTAGRTRYGLFEYRALSRDVAKVIMQDWHGDPERNRRTVPPGIPQHPLDGHVPRAVREWGARQTAKAIGKRLHAWWQLQVGQADPAAVAVQRTAFAATGAIPAVLRDTSFYEEVSPLVLSDLARYRAAHAALRHFEDGDASVQERIQVLRAREAERRDHAMLCRTPEFAALDELARSYGMRASLARLGDWAALDGPTPTQRATLPEKMENWRALCSPTGASYTSLNKTLDHLPGGVAPDNLVYLGMFRLPRPLLTRLELSVVCLYGKVLLGREVENGNEGPNARVFLHAKPERIKRAVGLVAAHTRRPLSHRRTADLDVFVRFLMDCPEEHNGNIVGLAERAIDWHRHRTQQATRREVEALGGDRATALPPIPLPQEEGITFLSTVEELVHEGKSMRNCVGSYYPRRAVQGQCYLFHAEHDGLAATAEVAPDGTVVQAAGPSNTHNEATAWARRVLTRWGRDFPERALRAVPEPIDEVPFCIDEVLF